MPGRGWRYESARPAWWLDEQEQMLAEDRDADDSSRCLTGLALEVLGSLEQRCDDPFEEPAKCASELLPHPPGAVGDGLQNGRQRVLRSEPVPVQGEGRRKPRTGSSQPAGRMSRVRMP